MWTGWAGSVSLHTSSSFESISRSIGNFLIIEPYIRSMNKLRSSDGLQVTVALTGIIAINLDSKIIPASPKRSNGAGGGADPGSDADWLHDVGDERDEVSDLSDFFGQNLEILRESFVNRV